jgi:hypothetical protein
MLLPSFKRAFSCLFLLTLLSGCASNEPLVRTEYVYFKTDEKYLMPLQLPPVAQTVGDMVRNYPLLEQQVQLCNEHKFAIRREEYDVEQSK